jgi:OOP family OmpA-OmpF porin
MKKLIMVISAAALVLGSFLPGALAARDKDVSGSKDHPLFNRMPGFVITTYGEQEFDSYPSFRDGEGKKATVEGRHISMTYFLKKGEEQPSEAQILKNFDNAVASAGGEVIFKKKSQVYFRMEDGGKVVWVYLRAFNRGRSYELHVIEEASLRQDIVVDADAMAKEIARTGKVSLYGIYFDTGKAELKPESDPALKEIATLLEKDTSLALYVVGHTDGTGEFGANKALSERRAGAVKDALVSRYGIAGSRLSPHGVGPLAPASTNDTPDGRTLNRRTELVKI